MELKRTVPFVTRSLQATGSHVLLLDCVEIAGSLPEQLRDRIARSLHLEAAQGLFDWHEAAALVEQQYEACLEYLYSHPFWEALRSGHDTSALRGYLLENRHYLAAASFRMASGIPRDYQQSPLSNLIAHHVVEEASHNVYFENALAALGCCRAVIEHARPLPATNEWIHVMRAVAARGPLCAALCSGLLEHTAKERATVRAWHEMLVQRDLLPADATNAIYEHVRTDMELGHGTNWKKALELRGHIPATELAECLNCISTVVEIIVRWFDMIHRATGGLIVEAMQSDALAACKPANRARGWETRGIPVWPAEVLDRVMYGSHDGETVDRIIGVAYACSELLDRCSDDGSMLITEARRLRRQLTGELDIASNPAGASTTPAGTSTTLASANATIDGWMRAINGHRLWATMAEQPTYALICGWLLENYHYISAIAQHTGAAIASSSDAPVRALLVHHLEEELDHGAILAKPLRCSRYGDVTGYRPLATTTAFVSALCELARRNWRAYVLALVFLQRTLSTGEDKQLHDTFYDRLRAGDRDAAPLIAAMCRHDVVDTNAGHGQDMGELIEALYAAGEVSSDHFAEAALIPNLCWSFLDGIRDHYRHGDMAVMSRIAWTAS